MNLGHFSSFLANFQFSGVDISQRKLLLNYPLNIFLAWQNKFLIFNNINQSKITNELFQNCILFKKLQNWHWYIFCKISPFVFGVLGTNSGKAAGLSEKKFPMEVPRVIRLSWVAPPIVITLKTGTDKKNDILQIFCLFCSLLI